VRLLSCSHTDPHVLIFPNIPIHKEQEKKEHIQNLIQITFIRMIMFYY